MKTSDTLSTISRYIDDLIKLGVVYCTPPPCDAPHWWLTPDGRVLSTASGRLKVLSGALKGRYLGVCVPSSRWYYVHQLMCEAFHGPRPVGQVVRHLDGNRFNNAATNLAWGTPADNVDDERRLGRTPRGLLNPMAKLTPTAVDTMRHLRRTQGWSYRRLAQKFDVATMTAYRAVEGQSWT